MQWVWTKAERGKRACSEGRAAGEAVDMPLAVLCLIRQLGTSARAPRSPPRSSSSSSLPPSLCSPAAPLPVQAIILQGQVRAQAEKDAANHEAEWRQLTDLVEADRRTRDARRQKEIAAREAQMAALFRQEFAPPAGKQRRSTPRAPGSGGAGAAAAGGAAADKAAAAAPGDAPLASADRVCQLKEELTKVLAATGGCCRQPLRLPGALLKQPSQGSNEGGLASTSPAMACAACRLPSNQSLLPSCKK